MKVPFLDLKTQYDSIREEVLEAFEQVLENTAFAGGPFVARFEKNFADFCQCQHAIGVGSGTEALWLALLGLGIGPGDEVMTVPNTFIATAEAISYCGATPVFVDIDAETYTMNPDLLEAAITPKTKAIIPVHLFGQMADMDKIMAIAKRHNLFVVEDACQAQGATYKGRRAGSIGDAGCFSFYPGKNLGAYGEAGAVVTNNSELALMIKQLRDHGQTKKYYHEYVGWNARMDGFQGAVLEIKLKYLEGWNESRRQVAKAYKELFFDEEEIILPKPAPYAMHVFHIFAIRVPDRDALINSLKAMNIHCGIHYPVPLHLQKAYRFLNISEGSFPVAEKCAREFVSLPMYPELRDEQIGFVARELKNVLSQSKIRYSKAS
jgi:dTDP-4-amino-4,6-dideoxygalactose transaminase